MNEIKTILVPLDGSLLSEKALPLATTLAQKFDSQLILVRALDFLHPSVMAPHLSTATAAALTEAYQETYEEAKNYLISWQDELRRQGFKTDILLRDTPPAEGILEAAETHPVDFIVMSTHGRGGVARWALGSIADKVVRHAPCPVLLVRQPAAGANKEKEAAEPA
jgi:nucleotide-binding universal stress UspA family protein